MKRSFLFFAALFGLASLSSAGPILESGTPNYLGYGLAPVFGHLINFDDLATQVSDSSTGFYQLPSNYYSSQGVASIVNSASSNVLYAAAVSQQSQPVYLTTGPSDNYAGNITIQLTKSVGVIGIGVLSDDVSPVTLNALGTAGEILASFTVHTSANSSTPENGYWAIRDSSNDIQGLEIVSTANLGIDDLQFAPEPSAFGLITTGALLVAAGVLRKRIK